MFTQNDYERLVDCLCETEAGKKIASGALGVNTEKLLREVAPIAQKLGLPKATPAIMERCAKVALAEVVRGGKRYIDQTLLDEAISQERDLAMHM